MDDWKQHIRSVLASFRPRPLLDPHRGDAAVLVALLADPEPGFLLTKRSTRVSTHKGHVSFPGGKREAADPDLETTALRETEEELGIRADAIELVGGFHEYMAATGHRVCPFIGLLPDNPPLEVDPAEVEYAFEVPFQFFLDERPRVEQVQWRGRPHTLYYYHYENDIVWGLTAAIIRDFLRLLEPDNPLLA